jgi:hypothetical protein
MEPEIVFCTKSYLVIIYIFEARDQGISSCILFKPEVTQFLRNKTFWNLGINLLTTAASSAIVDCSSVLLNVYYLCINCLKLKTINASGEPAKA